MTNRLMPFMRISMALFVLGLAACGGGAGSSGSPSGNGGGPPGQPHIVATIIAFPSGATPAGFVSAPYNAAAVVRITDQASSAPIANAAVTLNGTSLGYVAASQAYESALTVNPGAAVTVDVVVSGVSYTASRTQFSTYPTITAPAANTTWSIQAANLVSWSGAVPDSTSTYAFGLFDTFGTLTWPTGGGVQIVPTAQTSYTIGANSLSAGSRLLLVGIVDVLPLAGAAPGSAVLIGGFNYVPMKVADASSLTLQSIATSPASVTVGVGTSTQLAATGTYRDGSTQDLTTQVNWSPSDASKVTVNSSGLITGKAAGPATVTAQYASFSAATAVNVFQPNPSPTPPLNQAVTYQIDYAHSGRATFGGSGPSFPPSATWSVTLNGQISYPLIAGGKVFVTTAGTNSTWLYAIDEVSGNVAWGPTAISSASAWSGLTYDHGTLFTLTLDGMLRSFDAATGIAGWSVQLPGQGYTAVPTAVNGVVYVGGYAALNAVDEATGHILWIKGVLNGDESSPTVSSDGVFVSYPCQVYKFDPLVGTSLWHYDGGCGGGGGKTSVYVNNQLFVRELGVSPQFQIFNAATGAQLGAFPASIIPAFSAQAGYFLSNGSLMAIDQATHATLWTFPGDGGLIVAPIVIDGVVAIGSSSGTVYALDATSGHVLWSGSAGAPILGPDEQNASAALAGFGAGEGYLVVPAGSRLTGWRLIP